MIDHFLIIGVTLYQPFEPAIFFCWLTRWPARDYGCHQRCLRKQFSWNEVYLCQSYAWEKPISCTKQLLVPYLVIILDQDFLEVG